MPIARSAYNHCSLTTPRLCTLAALTSHYAHTVHSLCTDSLCTRNAPTMHPECTLCTHTVYSLCTGCAHCVPCTLTRCALCVHFVKIALFVSPLCPQSTPTAYQLHYAFCTLCTPLAYSPCVHRAHIVPYESICCAQTKCADCTLCMHSWCTYYAITVCFGYSHFQLRTHNVHIVHSLFVHPQCTYYAP